MAEAANIEQDVAVITGASSGIGHATALEFASKGYSLVLVARREKLLREVAAACEELGASTTSVAADTAEESVFAKIIDAAKQNFGHIDTWVNNAGVYLTARFEDTPMADIKRLMDINFYGYVYGSQAALQQFRMQGFGTLINVSSINATAPQPYVSIYSASKAAIRALDESIRMELRLDGFHKTIKVCTVMPASIDTNLFQNGANYTGQQVQALEPVYDATYAAKRIASLVDRPRRELIIGSAGRLMRQQNAHSPRMYEKRFASFTDKDLLNDAYAEPTTGNLYEPIESNTGISGGWRDTRLSADTFNKGLGIAAVVAATAIGAGYAFAHHKHHTKPRSKWSNITNKFAH